jgi:beta-glucosidase
MVSQAGDIIVPAGDYTLSVGGGQPGAGPQTVSGEFAVRGQVKLPE